MTWPQPLIQTQADASSGFTPQSFALSLVMFQMIFSNLHEDPYTCNSSISETGVPVLVFFSAFQCTGHFS